MLIVAFDGAFMHFSRLELQNTILGARVDKIFQPSKNVLLFHLRNKSFTGKLLISAEPSGSRIQITECSIENPATPPMLCMLLRKKLVGAKITGIRQPGLERVIYLDFDASNELGDPVTLSLIAELMGRRSNIILVNGENRIIDAVRRTDASDTTRILLPGAMYNPPPRNDWIDLSCSDMDETIKKIKSYFCHQF